MTGYKADGEPLAVDCDAVSADPSAPAFVARPPGAPVYYGFTILEDVVIDGFTLGIITAFEDEPAEWGDAFVIAPDNSRAGLVWERGDQQEVSEICAPEPSRWGVWGVWFPYPMDGHDNARRNLAFCLPEMKKRWEAWRAFRSGL
jgi:hypothetical protein